MDLGTVFAATKNVMDVPLTVYGFTFSFWQVFLWTAFAGIVMWAVITIIRGE